VVSPSTAWVVVGGGALGGVHGDRVAVGDVLAQILTGEGGPGAIGHPPRGDAVVVGVDGVRAEEMT